MLLSAALALGCSEAAAPSAAPQYEALVELDAWHRVMRKDDPFVAASDAADDFVLSGFRLEPDQHWLEVDTGACNWVTLSANARYPVEVGQMLRLRVSHYDLDAAAPTTAQLRVGFGDCDVWSKSIPIPSSANVEQEELASPCALSRGAAALFHVHNHGQNTYQLQALEILR
jgi:hypothetical protein